MDPRGSGCSHRDILRLIFIEAGRGLVLFVPRGGRWFLRRLWRLITVIGPAVITATFKDTRAVSIQKYNNSTGVEAAISLKAVAASIMACVRGVALERTLFLPSFARLWKEEGTRRRNERGRATGEQCKLERSDYSSPLRWNFNFLTPTTLHEQPTS